MRGLAFYAKLCDSKNYLRVKKRFVETTLLYVKGAFHAQNEVEK